MNQNALIYWGVFVFCHSFVTLFLLDKKRRAYYNILDNLTTGGVSAEVMKDPEAPPLPLGKTARGSREKCRTKKLINGRAFLLHKNIRSFLLNAWAVMRFISLFVSIVLGFFLPFVFVLAHAPDGLQDAAGGAFFMSISAIEVNSS